MVGDADSTYFFDHCILKTQRNTSDLSMYNMVLKNEDPLFLYYQENDYRIDTLSPAIGYGDPAISSTVPFDLIGNPRAPLPDLGVYQFVPGQNEDN